MQEKYINIAIIFVLLLLSIRVLINFNRQKSFYAKLLEGLRGGDIYRKMISLNNNPSPTSEEDKIIGCEEIIAKKNKQSYFELSKGRKKTRRGMNNCLFDSVIEAFKKEGKKELLPTEDSQKLREICDEILEKEGFPLIPHGEPAGEQYIQALSKLLNHTIKIHKDHPDNFVADVKHSDVSDVCPSISIVHLGSEDCGHWVSLL